MTSHSTLLGNATERRTAVINTLRARVQASTHGPDKAFVVFIRFSYLFPK